MSTFQQVLFAVLWVTATAVASWSVCTTIGRLGVTYTDWPLFAVTWAWCLTLGVLLWTALV